MTDLTLERAAHTTPVVSLSDTEPAGIDLDRMRRYRLGRLREQLAAQDVGACVLTSPYSIRYATGFRNCAVYQTHIEAGYLFVHLNRAPDSILHVAAVNLFVGLKPTD